MKTELLFASLWHISIFTDVYLLLICYALFTKAFRFSQCNDIVFNSLQSVYIVFRPKRYQLFFPTDSLHLDRLNHIPETK